MPEDTTSAYRAIIAMERAKDFPPGVTDMALHNLIAEALTLIARAQRELVRRAGGQNHG